MIVLIKQMKAKDGMEKELEECLTASITNVENDPDSGLAEYRIFRGEGDDPQIFCTFLKFHNADGLETYRGKDYLKEAAPAMVKCVESHAGYIEIGGEWDRGTSD